MRPEPLTSVDDADWLSLRLQLWPDCPREQHLEEMASFLLEPTRFVRFIVRDASGRGLGFAEASIRTDYVNGTSSPAVSFSKSLGHGRAD